MFWWKLVVLQALIAAVTCSSELEFEDDSKLTNKNILWLFNKFLENINKQRDTDDSNDQVENIQDTYQLSSLVPLNRDRHEEKSTENDMKNSELQQITFEDQLNTNSISNKKRDKNLLPVS